MPMPREMLPESPKEWVLFLLYRFVISVVLASGIYLFLFFEIFTEPWLQGWYIHAGIFIVLIVICMVVPFYVMDILRWPDRNSKD